MAGWLDRNRSHILWTLVNFTGVGLIYLWVLKPEPTPMRIETPVAPTPTTQVVRVYVSGAVAAPDVYLMAPGAIVKDALVAAGGPSARADLDLINLALPVADGDQVYVPQKAETPPMRLLVPVGTTAEQININRASQAEFEELPGIGAVMAQRILEYRRKHGFFSSVDELCEVKGIGSGTLEKLRDLVTVR